MKQIGQHAVVIGASMGGLLAARALADVYEQVTVLERDTFSPPGEPRKGVPQGRHAHALLAKGREILEDFFPGLTRELLEQGAIQADAAERFRFHVGGDYHQRIRTGLETLYVSRPCLEAHVRTRLLALPNVRAIEQCDVKGLVATADASRVTGVRVLQRASERAEEILQADLVVDASGRGSQAPAWLEGLGYAKPEEERVRVGVGYTSRFYRRKPEHLGGDLGILIFPPTHAPLRRGAGVFAQEGDRWLVTLGGYFGDHAPTDEEGFLAYAKSLATMDVYEVIKDAEPLSEFATYKFAASLRRRYEKLTRFPEGFLVFGDAICSFNPLYGQGMTVAALEAVSLRHCLGQGTMQLSRRFFQHASKLVDVPWRVAVGGDLRFPETEGPRPPIARFLNWYMAKVQVAVQRDPVVTLAFRKVNNMVAPPSTLLHPRIALRVLRANLRPARRGRSIEPTPVPALTQR